ncbi:MAG: response regulator [Bernardetiaceae bacterium]|nr:response regulator [Bernardetiaceae bacterium]
MRWLNNNLRITYKLTFSYLIIALGVVLTGVFLLKDVQHLEETSNEMASKHFKAIKLLTHIAEAYPMTLSKTRDILLTENSSQKEIYRSQVQAYEQDILQWSRELEQYLTAENERKIYESYIKTLDDFKVRRIEVLRLAIEENKQAEAVAVLYGQLQDKSEKLKEIIDKLIDTKEKVAEKVQQDTQNTVRATFIKGGLGAGFILLLTFFMPFVVNYHISRPIMRLEEKAACIAVGDLNKDKVVNEARKDEIGRVSKSLTLISENLDSLVQQAEEIAQGNYETKVNIRSEKDELGESIAKMTDSLRDQNWLKEGMHKLNQLLSGHFTAREVSQRTISFLGEFLEVGCGVFYVYEEKDKMLRLYSSYAFVERDRLSTEFKMGEGIVGQVALERKPILLKNIQEQQLEINSGTVSRKPLNTYAFPLVYEGELCAVVELASHEAFTPLKKRLIQEASETMASHIYSTLQSERIQVLFESAQQAKKEAQLKAKEAEEANEELKKQQVKLQQQAEELQQQTEEMQQQSEELQQSNEELQQQQEQLEIQREELQKRNEDLMYAQHELEEKAAELTRASKYKSEFLANMSHELRTPLNSIILLSDMLRRNTGKGLSVKDVQKATIIYQSGNDLLTLINDILDISKIEAGRMVVNIYHFHTRELVDQLQALFEEVAKQKGLEFHIVDELNCELYNDRDKIAQVLKNFLSNAFKFTKQGSVTLKLADSGDPKLPVKISVIDTGIGIPEAKQKIIFEAFQQVDGSVSREFGGTGLGLSIAREMSALLGGEVNLSSEDGKGSEFFVQIPYENHLSEEKIQNRQVEVNFEDKDGNTHKVKAVEQPISRTLANIKTQSTSKPHIKPRLSYIEIDDDRDHINDGDALVLIVEDNIDYANSLAEISRNIGFKAIIATQGKQVLKDIKKFNPVGILLDLNLPDINGAKLLEQIKQKPEFRHIPVSIVSANDRNLELLEKGAIGYLQKPVEANHVKETVMKLAGISSRKTKHLLIVEDNEVQQEFLLDLFNQEGVVCKGVYSEEEARVALKEDQYDAIIADLNLAGGSGLGLCRYLKEQNIDLPVIIYTGKDLTPQEKEELRLYAVGIIIKHPEAHKELIEKARIFLHKVYQERPNTTAQNKAKDKSFPLDTQTHNKKTKGADAKSITIKEQKNTAEATQVKKHKAETNNVSIAKESPEALSGNLEAFLEEGEGSDLLAGKNILIVDDDIRNVFVITSALENHEAEIHEALNGKEALDVLAEENIDIILMDIMMPVMDGYETMRAIRADENLKHIPIIAVTAKALKEDRDKCIEAGADEYLTKPVDYNLLLKMIESQLRKVQ